MKSKISNRARFSIEPITFKVSCDELSTSAWQPDYHRCVCVCVCVGLILIASNTYVQEMNKAGGTAALYKYTPVSFCSLYTE